MEDEGVGVYLARILKEFPLDADIMEMGSLSLSFILEIGKRDILIFIDALKPDLSLESGWFELKGGIIPVKHSLHEMSIIEFLGVMKLMGNEPKKAYLFGIRPFSLNPRIGLSEKMKKKLPYFKRAFIRGLKELMQACKEG